jgi:hypothetical protein
MSHWGRIDVLVNSAGHGPRAPVLELTDEDWHTGMDVYFMNAVRPTRLVTPIMQEQGGGSIINISTFAAFEPDPVFPTSGVFRAGLAAFTKLFSDKYAGDNIRMNNVLPGFIDSLPEKEEFRARIPMGRYGRSYVDCLGRCDAGVRGRRIHYRAEHPCRWWYHPFGLMSEPGLDQMGQRRTGFKIGVAQARPAFVIGLLGRNEQQIGITAQQAFGCKAAEHRPRPDPPPGIPVNR